mmetsp:Transcript_27408/g.34054  ORF Transcript_27408/g.34054 Transcript_27408/m.34054 type:complete len:108 (-) Transcript_27408:14-337(-)
MSVLFWVLDSELASDKSLSLLITSCIDRRTVKGSEEVQFAVGKVVADVAASHDKVGRDAVDLGKLLLRGQVEVEDAALCYVPVVADRSDTVMEELIAVLQHTHHFDQ